MSISKVFLRFVFALCFFLSSGCATFGKDARNQAVLVQSFPPGAEVHLDDKPVGHTPMYVLVPRKRSPQLTLSRAGNVQTLFLRTKYRWGPSFFSNFVFYLGAPIGWIWDLASGSAWNPQDPPIVIFKNPSVISEPQLPQDAIALVKTVAIAPVKTVAIAPVKSVAIAPPFAETLPLSNAAVPLLQNLIDERKGTAGYHALPFDQTLPLFLERNFDYDSNGNDDDRRMLYQSLDGTAVWHSLFKRNGDVMDLSAELEDTRTHAVIDTIDVELDREDERSKFFAQGLQFFKLPNTVTFSLSNDHFSYERPNGGSISLHTADTDVWWQKGLQYLSSLSVSNVPVYRPDRTGRWIFNFKPVFTVSRSDLVAGGSAEVDGQVFTRWLGAVGYGPEIGYQVGRHYIYVDVDFLGVATNISWVERGQSNSITNMSTQSTAELGYIYEFTQSWSARLFAMSSPEDAKSWREALVRTSNSAVGSVGDGVASNSSAGISVGFNYEPFFAKTFRNKSNVIDSSAPQSRLLTR